MLRRELNLNSLPQSFLSVFPSFFGSCEMKEENKNPKVKNQSIPQLFDDLSSSSLSRLLVVLFFLWKNAEMKSISFLIFKYLNISKRFLIVGSRRAIIAFIRFFNIHASHNGGKTVISQIGLRKHGQ